MTHTRRIIRAMLPPAGLLLALCGCSRSTVTISPGDAIAADGQPRPAAQEALREGKKSEAPPGDGFRFPDDHGGELVGKLLTPTAKVPAQDDLAGPRRFPRSAAVEAPALPVPQGQPEVGRLPGDKPAARLRPGAVPEGLPLADSLGEPALPEARGLPAGEGVRLPSDDVERPVPLPLLGQLTPERAPLDDPTSDASQAAALAAAMPERTTPAPFLKLTLPDPFENRAVVRLPTLPPEDTTPTNASPRSPKP